MRRIFHRHHRVRPSSGAQEKWEKDGLWYKVDTSDESAEGLCEKIASDMLAKSNVNTFTRYDVASLLNGRGERKRGCISRSFIPDGSAFYDTQTILTNLCSPIASMSAYDLSRNPEGNMRLVVEAMNSLPGIVRFEDYLAKMFRFDTIIRNGDRTLYNFGVLRMKNGTSVCYSPAPLFDHGQSLAMQLYTDERTVFAEDLIDAVAARPFSGNFEAQAAYAEGLAGGVKFETAYTKADLLNSLNECGDVYPEHIIERARDAMFYLMEKYVDYFRGEDVSRRLDEIISMLNIPDTFAVRKTPGAVLLKNKNNAQEQLIIIPSGTTIAKQGERSVSLDELILKHRELFSLTKMANDAVSEWTRNRQKKKQ